MGGHFPAEVPGEELAPLPHRLPHRPGRSRTVPRCPETHIVSCPEEGTIHENAHKHSLFEMAGNRLQAWPIGLRNRRSQVRILSGAYDKNPAQAGFFVARLAELCLRSILPHRIPHRVGTEEGVQCPRRDVELVVGEEVGVHLRGDLRVRVPELA